MADAGHTSWTFRHRGNRCRRAGFTLIEAIIVMLLVGVVLTIAAPSLRGVGKELESAASEAAAVFRQTRSAAMARTAAYRVSVVSPTELRGEFASTCGSTTWETDTRVRLDLRDGIVMAGDSIIAGKSLVCYSSRGLGDASPTFTVRDRRGREFRIDVFVGGAVDVAPVIGGGS